MKMIERFVRLLMLVVVLMSFVSPVSAGKNLYEWLWDLPGLKLWMNDNNVYYTYDSTNFRVICGTESKRVVETVLDLPATSSATVATIVITTMAFTNGTTTWVPTMLTMSGVPMNLLLSIGVQKNTSYMVINSSITGWCSSGKYVTETFISSSSAVNISSYAYSEPPVISWTMTPNRCKDFLSASVPTTHLAEVSNITLNVGTGVMYGFSNDIATTAELRSVAHATDSTKISTGTCSATYDTWGPADPVGAYIFRLAPSVQ